MFARLLLRLLFFVEYVPVEKGTEHLMLEDADIKELQGFATWLEQEFGDMIVVSFPGDGRLHCIRARVFPYQFQLWARAMSVFAPFTAEPEN
ncbi:hypothetical protein LJC56_04595 [Christensenellaceae bacterium OttesenSCG-928-K19]|nr:hypothetical protein [Christensenellaceae bacterium OttesenSCG-928-K19]